MGKAISEGERGRPPGTGRTGRETRVVHVRLDIEERKQLEMTAADAGITVSSLLRSKSLNRPIPHKADLSAVASIKSAAGLIKKLHNDGLGHAKESRAAVNALIAAADLLKSKLGEQA